MEAKFQPLGARAARRVADARTDLRVAILLARASGETLADIARAAGLSPQRIAQIIREREERGER